MKQTKRRKESGKGERIVAVLRQLYEIGMKEFEAGYGKAPRDLWERYRWDDERWVELIVEFTRARYKRLADRNETPNDVIKRAIDSLTCPIVISPEHMEFGTDAANIGEFTTLGLLRIVADRADFSVSKLPETVHLIEAVSIN